MNRQSVVKKHNPIITRVEKLSPLSIGNGEFGFSADFTGLQTFPEAYESPLSTQSNWGWHYSQDRKSTRLNSSHVAISYAVFCLKKKRAQAMQTQRLQRQKPKARCHY